MKVQRICWCVLMALLGIAANALAGWQEDQAALFQKTQVKSGDRIDSSNWEKVKEILPPSIAEWVKRGDYILDIGKFDWDFNVDQAFHQKSAANKGKYIIDQDGGIIEKATGKPPVYVEGDPFPYQHLDWKNDPAAGSKIIYNAFLKASRAGELHVPHDIDWVGRDGHERRIGQDWHVQFYWNRPEGRPINNPGNFLMTELISVKEPYDLSGILSLNLRAIENVPDQVYAYVPAIRRVKKISGTTRSSPALGTDFVNDDGLGWMGKIESMNWKALDQKMALIPMMKWAVKGPAEFVKQADGSWAAPKHIKSPTNGYETPGWKGAPWAPTDIVWVPRTVYVVEATPKDPYYNYGKTTYYIDPIAGIAYKIIYDKNISYWKSLAITYVPAKWGEDDKVTVSSAAWYCVVDDKKQHASIANALGQHAQKFHKHIYRDPEVKSSIFSPTALPALSK